MNSKKQNNYAEDKKSFSNQSKDKEMVTDLFSQEFIDRIFEGCDDEEPIQSARKDENNVKVTDRTIEKKPRKIRKKLTSKQKIGIGISIIATIIVYILFGSFPIYYHNVEDAVNSNPGSYRMVDGAIAFKDISRPGYEFEGWYADKNYDKRIYGIKSGSLGLVDIYAKWDLIEYHISYDLDGGTLYDYNPYSYTVEDNTITLSDPYKTGYRFLGWYTDNNVQVTSIYSGSTGDLNLYARFEEERYSITYCNTYNADNPNPTSYTVNDVVKFEKIKRKGYKFTGWRYGGTYGTEIDDTEGYTYDLYLYATWELANYTVTYDLKGGSCYSSLRTSFTINNRFALPSDVTKKGYTFDGWYDKKGNKYTSVYDVYDDLNIYAKFTPITYTITYTNTKGVFNPNPSTYDADDGSLELMDLPDDGNNIFDGWTKNGSTVYYLDAATYGNVTVSARWRRK